MRAALLLALCAILSGCTPDSYDAPADSGHGGGGSDLSVEARASDLRAGSYEEAMGSGDCTQDCAGHEAGWTWARDRGVDDETQCPAGGSQSFREGCEAYAKVDEVASDEIDHADDSRN